MIIEADLIRRLDDLHERLLKLEYPEPETGVQKPERWKDVTGECEWQAGQWFQVRMVEGARVVSRVTEANGYRLRKVRLLQYKDGEKYVNTYGEGDAFIIERRED